jgi:K+-sensing histidine kinase KdpD
MRKPVLLTYLWIVLALLSTFADYATGPFTDPFFLIVPVGLAAWFSGRAYGIAMALTTAIVRSWFHFVVWDEHFSTLVSLANSVLAVTVLTAFAEMVHRIATSRRNQARMLDEQRKLIQSLEEARENIKVLSGLLPICSSCKKIRDSEGYWEQIEQYIRSHSEAEFSHGICPECMKKLYPEFSVRDDN